MTYKELKEFLIKCSNSYYIDNISLISDYEFDMKLKELEKMEEEQGFKDPDSPTIKVGSDLSSDDLTNKHQRKMLSIENTYNKEELQEWYEKMKLETGDKNLECIVERKVDGGSCAIRFKNGKIIKALTRGTGELGEDITQNVSLLDFSKVSKDFSGEVRGELVMTNSGFEILNKNNEYQNPRNLLSGSMKLLDPEEFKKRAPYIKFIAYWNETPYSTHFESLKALNDAGFENSLYSSAKLVNNFEDLYSEVMKIGDERPNLEYGIDGAVIKINNENYWKLIGETAKYPKWTKAYKFKQEQVETTVTKIDYQVGRTGKITGLCYFEPVFLEGSTISKATLNNKDWQDNLNIGIGDKIIVEKAAYIIPYIVKVSDRKGRTSKAVFPTYCPSCNSKLEKLDPSQADYYCLNNNCQARICDTISNFTHSMSIDGFADIVIEKVHNIGILNNIADIYDLKLHKKKLENLDRFGEKMVKNLLENIEKSKSQPLEKLIAGLGIKNVGPKLAKTLAKEFKSLKVIESLSKEELTEIDDIGDIVADSIIKYFKNTENKKIIKRLEEAKLNFTSNTEESKAKINLSGKTFVITGALSMTRDKYINIIEMCGGKVSGSISSKTSYLITNDKFSGSTKNKAAQALGIPILNEKELLELCGELELLKELKWQ